MWKNNVNNVNKMVRNKRRNGRWKLSSSNSRVSPQVDILESIKNLLVRPLKRIPSINTPNSSNKFYI